MTWQFAAFTYLVTWWIVLIAVLPFGAKPPVERPPGHAAGAPENPMLRRKLIATTLIAALLVGGFAWLLESGLVPLRDAMQ